MRPADVARRGGRYLARHGVVSADVEAETLLLRILEIDRTALLTRDADLSPAEATAFGRALCRRCVGTPLQHITGEQGFRRLVIEVRPGVFVPRPETEVLVSVALAALSGQAPVVVDLCTGTGVVALAIADEYPSARVFATDVSHAAVALAADNARRLGLDVTVKAGDLFSSLPASLRGMCDLVVANPPYVPIEDEMSLPREVLADPRVAVFGKAELYDRMFQEATSWLRPGGAVVVEIDGRAASEVVATASRAGFKQVRLTPDLAGRDRVIDARWP
jgi:release factor glutamine methyltransferase